MQPNTTLPSPRPDPWQLRAACRTYDPSIFYPDDARDPRASDAAIAICRTCPVLTPCRTYALTHPEPHGVWGGLSEQQRQAILKRRSRNRPTRQLVTLTCRNDTCHRTFTTTAPHAKYCSQKCRNTANERERYRRR